MLWTGRGFNGHLSDYPERSFRADQQLRQINAVGVLKILKLVTDSIDLGPALGLLKLIAILMNDAGNLLPKMPPEVRFAVKAASTSSERLLAQFNNLTRCQHALQALDVAACRAIA